jgi:serine/threonine-protein kinase
MSDDPSTSPLSVRLQVATPQQPIVLRPMPEREDLAKARAGTRIKGWRLLRFLGVGPLTAAYEAIHGEKDSGDRGVLRILTGDLAKNERAKGQFLRASYAANRFRHPRVVPIVADGTDDDGAPYVIRAFNDGKPLGQVVAEARASTAANGAPAPRGLEPNRVLRMMVQVLDALEIAHAHGVVHGAISPDNVLMTPRGSIRLVDFATPPGTSIMGQDVRDVLADSRIGPFTPPERCGVPPSMPTEQTDVWAIAACAYYALSGAFPRGKGAGRAELATAPSVPLRDVMPEAPEPIAAMLDHALQLEPEQRYGSAYAMLGDVRRALAGRRPKLGDALRPVPSGSYRDVSRPSSRRVVLADAGSSRGVLGGGPTPGSSSSQAKRQRDEWRGNLLLIMAIALLVGVATFVVVRERIDEERRQNTDEPR